MTLQEIKATLRIETVLDHYGLKADKNHRLHCPFHSDTTPSMQVYQNTDTVYCFSSNCKTHGKSLDVIDFVMYKENATKAEAREKAMTLLGQTENKTAPNHPTPEETPVNPHPVLTQLFKYFTHAVPNSKPARDYLDKRHLDYTKLAVGYNTGQFHHGARRDEELIKQCVEVHVLTPFGTNSRNPNEQAYKVFGKECIVFALKDERNTITGMYFRSIHDTTQSRHYYLKNSQGLYPNYPHPHTKKLLIAESIIDTASLLQLETITKEYSLLASYGTNRLTEEHLKAIHNLKELEEITFAFDKDEAGGAATAKYSKHLKTKYPKLRITYLDLPCKDVNETLQAHTETVFDHLISTRKEVVLREEGFENQGETTPNNYSENIKPAVAHGPVVAHGGFITSNALKLIYSTEGIEYQILGGLNRQLDSLKITLLIMNKKTMQKHRTKVDLYEDKQVEKTIKETSEKLDLNESKISEDLYQLTEHLENYREMQNTPKEEEQTLQQHILTVQEQEQLQQLGRTPKLIDHLNTLLGKTGIVGEEKNRIFLLIIAASYKMPETLHALIQGSSGSGKTRLLKQISDCIPKEKVTKLTRVSDKVLYNYPESYFVNRLLCLEDIDGLSEDAEFAFRELQSNGELNSAASNKLENGKIVAGEKKVKGPIASLACTTRGEIYEDNMSRVFLLAVDESLDQTRQIIDYQNKKAAGLIDKKEEQQTTNYLRYFIHHLKPYEVKNPYANKIHLPEEAHKIRRLNDLFQSFVKMITVFNQYQRKQDDQKRLLTEIEDIETAVSIMFESIVLKVDELDGSLRQFYEKLKQYLKKRNPKDYETTDFSLLEVRQNLQVSKTQLFRYMQDLQELEYVRQMGGHANRGYKYKINYWDNYEKIRERIKTKMSEQVEALRNT